MTSYIPPAGDNAPPPGYPPYAPPVSPEQPPPILPPGNQRWYQRRWPVALIAAIGGAVLALAACGSSGHNTASSSPAPAIASSPSVATSPDEPLPNGLTSTEDTPVLPSAPAGSTVIDTQTTDGNSATIAVTAKKLGGPSAPFHDGDQPASAVAFKLTIVDVRGNTYLNNSGAGDGFTLEPSNSGSLFVPGYDASDNNTDLEKKLCQGVPSLGDALGQDVNSEGFDLIDGKTYSGCVVFDFFGNAQPNTLAYADSQSGVSKTTIWLGHIGRGPAATMPAPFQGTVYTVTSDGGINSVTYSTPGFSQQQDTDVSGNTWTKKIPSEIQIPVLVAQNAGGGSISCTISVDGTQVDHETSHGQYAVVTCNGGGN